MPRSIALRCAPVTGLLLAALVAPAVHAQSTGSVALAVDCRELEPVLVPGAIPAHFLPNVGQRDDGIDFHLPAIGGGLTVGPAGISYGTGDGAVVQRFPGATPVFRAGVGDPTEATTTVLAGGTTWALPDAGAVETDAFVPGITLGLTSTHRVLTLRLDAVPGSDPGAVRWIYDGAAEAFAAPGDGGHLRVRRTDGSHLDVRAPHAWQVDSDGTEVPLDAAFTLDPDGSVGLSVAAADPARSWHLEIETLFAPAGARYRTVRHDQGFVVAAGTTAARGGDDGDVLVFALDGDGAIHWTTLLAGDGEDQPHAVAVDQDGSILVAGATASRDFPALAGEGAGGLDGFVVRLAPLGLGATAGTRIHAGAGDDAAGALLIEGDGSILIGGQGEVAPESEGAISFSALVPTLASEQRPTYLSRLDPGLTQTTDTATLWAPELRRLDVWRGCNGDIVFGVAAESSSGCGSWPKLSYEMDYRNEDYDLDHDYGSGVPGLGSPLPGGFGYHALRWRYYQANDLHPPANWTVDWTLAPNGSVSPPIPAIPKAGANCYTEPILDTLELDLFEHNGSTIDPPGGWGCLSHTNEQKLALAAAFYSQRYGSPTYTNFRIWEPWNNNGAGGWTGYTIAIEETEWEVQCPPWSNYNGQRLEDLCDFSSGWLGGVNCTAYTSGVVGADFSLFASRFEGVHWKPLVWYQRGIGFNTDRWWDFYTAGDLIVDPPDDPYESLLIEEAVTQLSGYTASMYPVRLDVYEGGAVTSSSVGSALLPSAGTP